MNLLLLSVRVYSIFFVASAIATDATTKHVAEQSRTGATLKTGVGQFPRGSLSEKLENAILSHLTNAAVRFKAGERVTSDVPEFGHYYRYLGGCGVSVVSHDEKGNEKLLFSKG